MMAARRLCTPDVLERIAELAADGLHAGAIARVLGFDARRIGEWARANGIKLPRKGPAPEDAPPWTPEDEDVMRRRYPDEPTAVVAAALGRTLEACYNQAHRMGLCKSEEFHRSEHTARRKAQEGTSYRRMGDWRVFRGMLQKKTGPRRWEYAPAALWAEAGNEPPPHGHVAVWREGMATTDPAGATVDKVEVITRKELMRRNSRHTRYGPEYNKIVNLRMALDRKIKNITERNPK